MLVHVHVCAQWCKSLSESKSLTTRRRWMSLLKQGEMIALALPFCSIQATVGEEQTLLSRLSRGSNNQIDVRRTSKRK